MIKSLNINSDIIAEINQEKAKRCITLMVVLASLNYTIGTIPWATYFSIRVLFQCRNYFVQHYLYTIGISFVYSLVVVKFFVYYFTNKLYRKVLNSYALNLKYFFLNLFNRSKIRSLWWNDERHRSQI